MTAHTADPPVELTSLAKVRTPRTAVRLTWVLLLGLCLLPAGLVFVPWTQTVHGGGRAIAFDPVQRPQFLVSPIEGRVTRWHVVEGQRVVKGQRILDLVDNDPNFLLRLFDEKKAIQDRLAAEEARVREIDARVRFLQNSRTSELARQRAVIETEKQRKYFAESMLIEAKAAVDAAKPNLLRTERLLKNVEGGLASQREYELAKLAMETATAREKQATALVEQAAATITAADELLSRVDADTNAIITLEKASLESAKGIVASAQRDVAQIETRISRQQAQHIDAPTDGVIWQLLANAEAGGILVRPGERLARLVPDIKPKAKPPAEVLGGLAALVPIAPAYEGQEFPGIVVEVGIDGNDLPLVREGDKVRLQFEGWPAVQFAGWPSVAVGTFGGRVYLVDPTANETGRFRVLVEPDPDERPWPNQDYLRQGVRAQGWVLLQEVTAGWEIWRQINGFPPTREPKTKMSGQVLGPVGGK
jgi:multidrug efflux pump subunit AcrA (membrane-fusion protein)